MTGSAKQSSEWIQRLLDYLVASLLAMTRKHLRGVLEPLQRLDDPGLPRHGRLTLFFFFLDDFFRRVRDEFLVGKFGVDALDVGLGPRQFLVEPRPLCRKIDQDPLRQRCDL